MSQYTRSEVAEGLFAIYTTENEENNNHLFLVIMTNKNTLFTELYFQYDPFALSYKNACSRHPPLYVKYYFKTVITKISLNREHKLVCICICSENVDIRKINKKLLNC